MKNKLQVLTDCLVAMVMYYYNYLTGCYGKLTIIIIIIIIKQFKTTFSFHQIGMRIWNGTLDWD